MAKYKVLISDALSKEAVEILQKEKDFSVDVDTKLSPEKLKEVIGNYDALCVRSGTKVTKDIIEAADKLKIIGRAGVGLDNVDVEAASKKGVIVVNTPAGNTISTAEHALTLMLSMSRNIPQADLSMKRGEWERKKFTGHELYGKSLGIVGLGRIGTEVARRAISFGMKILAYDPYLSMERAKELGMEPVDLDTLFKNADYITVHTPLTEQTNHLISDKQFDMMKKGVRLVNAARGGIIDEAALARAIESGKVAGAALDVYEDEPPKKDNKLLSMDKLVLTPHLGASTEEAQTNVAIEVAVTVRDYLSSGCVKNAVNVPCLEPEVCKVIDPYVKLAEKIGAMQAQLIEGHIKQVKIRYVGEIVKYDLTSFTLAIMKGMLTPILQETVNFVNSMVIARERGIKVIEAKTAEVQDFASLIIVEVETDRMKKSIIGTLLTKVHPRIVKIDDSYVDSAPEGYMLVTSNKDVPGIIGQIGTILGRNGVNIAAMSFGRESKGGTAVSVLNVDSKVPESVLEEIRKSPNIYGAKLVKV